MKLFFIYDASNSDPDDDPRKSIIYSYPPQKELDSDICLLYCQIIGIARFIKSTFGDLSVITLDNGNFVPCQVENYLFILGGNENETKEFLKAQMQLINKIFAFYNFSLGKLLTEVNEDYSLFQKKLSKIMTLYLFILYRSQSIMQSNAYSIPVKLFPFNHNVKAINLLNVFQSEFGVLAGAVFCHKQLLYTQFLPYITTSISFVISCSRSGNDIPVKYKLPPGVKLKRIYLTEYEAKYLQKHRCQHFVKNRKKTLNSSTAGSEADVDSDYPITLFSKTTRLNETSEDCIDSYAKDSYGIFPVNLPCPKHQNFSKFEQKGSFDVEFQCFLCLKRTKYLIKSRPHFLLKLKRSYSEMDVASMNSLQKLRLKVLPTNERKHSRKHRKSKILKHSNSSSSQDTDAAKSKWTDIFHWRMKSSDHFQNKSVLTDKVCHSFVLYIQKYGHCALTLLLDTIPLSHTALNLCLYGLSVLPSIAYDTKNIPASLEENNFSIYTYKYKSKLLHGSKIPEFDCVKSNIHEDFYNDPLLHCVSVIECTRSICSYNTKDKQIFYEQPGVVHHKTDWFFQFWERAYRRTERYLNIFLPSV